jgi:chromosome partitioning protein
MRQKIVGVTNTKGGSGKSTVAIHVAHAAAQDGRDVCVVDADSQGTVKDWANARPDNRQTPRVIYDDDPLSLHATIERLQHELVIIDSPGELSEMTGEVLGVSDLALVPITPSILDLWGMDEFEQILKERAERGLKVALVTTKYNHASKLGEQMAEHVEGEYPYYEHFAGGLCSRVAYKRQMAKGQTVLEGSDEKAKNEVRVFYDATTDLLYDE